MFNMRTLFRSPAQASSALFLVVDGPAECLLVARFMFSCFFQLRAVPSALSPFGLGLFAACLAAFLW
jgi:hypothetical protein